MRIKENPIKLIANGHLDGIERRRLVQRGRKTKVMHAVFDGFRLDKITLATRIYSVEDAEAIIKLLEISKYCLPYENGTYVKS